MPKFKIQSSNLIALAVLLLLPMAALWADDAQYPKFKFGYSQRIRIETSDNVKSLIKPSKEGFCYVRNRMNLSLLTNPMRNMTIGLGLATEMRYNLVPENGYAPDEIFFDQLYVKLDSLAGKPVSLTLGRQNIMLGEGFVVMDGGPLDGSRSSYFNAARVDWSINSKHSLSLIYLYQPEYDKYLPAIDDIDKALVEQPEEGFILYHTGKLGKLDLQSYFIRKNMKETDTRSFRKINCPGVRLQYPVCNRLKLTGEAAFQFGRVERNLLDDIDTSNYTGIGCYLYGEYTTGWPIHLPKNFILGTVRLSGRDRTADNTAEWNPLFGRWPKWSDSYIYALIAEQGVAYWTNLQSVFVKTSLDIVPDLTLSLDYHHMRGIHANYSGNGLNRGDLIIGRLTYKANEHLSGHFIWEGFNPGDYYDYWTADYDYPFGHVRKVDSYGWVRMEMMLKF
jgi:hypothetical protein